MVCGWAPGREGVCLMIAAARAARAAMADGTILRTGAAGGAVLAGLRFSLVGPGRVGSSLAAWAEAAGAQRVATAGSGDLAGLESAGQDLVLIAVPDGALPAVAERLAGRPQAA